MCVRAMRRAACAMPRLPSGSDDVDAGVEMSMHYITDDAPELRVDLLRAVLPGYEVVGSSIDEDDEDGDDDDAFGHHRREYFVYSATRPVQ